MKKSNWLVLVLLMLVAAGVWLAAAQATDKAKDPVCGMSVDKATAKWTYDYKGTTYYFCNEGCKTSFAKEPEKYLAPGAEKKMMGGMMQGQMKHAQAADPAKAIDPVCGMSVDKATAKWTYDYKGTTYYFCNEGCKTSFAKEPEKYLATGAEKKMMGGMMHGQMRHAQAMPGHEDMAGCPMMLPDVERKVEVVKDGVVVTMTSKNAETVKKIQEHAAKMAEAKKDAATCPMAKAEGACAACGAKK